MYSNISIKNKTLFLVVITLLFASLSLIFLIYVNQKSKIEELDEQSYNTIKNSYEKVLQKHKKFYKYRLEGIINTENVKEAFWAKDRKRLIQLLEPKFHLLKKENKSVELLHFHLPDGTSFLRLHKIDLYGDEIAKKRKMVKAMHTQREFLSGFEAGLYMLAYRESMPIFYDGEYLGSLEVGSRPDQILDELNYLSRITGALFVKENKLIQYEEKSDFILNGYKLQYTKLEDKKILDKLPKTYNFKEKIEIEFQKKTYVVYPFDLNDFAGAESAKVLYFKDITNIKNRFLNTLSETVTLLIFLMAIVVFVINTGFSSIVRSLQNHKRFSNSILENSAHAIITTDIQGIITLFNTKAKEMLGYDAKNLLGKETPILFYDKESIKNKKLEFENSYGIKCEHLFDLLIAKTKMGIVNHEEWTLKDINGKDFVASIYITALKDDNGVSGYLFMLEDITFRKILEDTLDQQKNELETIFQTIKEGIAIIDLETNFLFVNQSYTEMSGYSRDELAQTSCLALTIEEEKQKTKDAIKIVLDNGYLENIEKRCTRKDTQIINVNISMSLMPDKQRILISVRDVSDAKVKEKKLFEYLQLVDKNIITSSTDLDGNITHVSKAFCEISGYKKEELLGRTHALIRSKDIPESFYKEMWDTIQEGKIWKGEIKNTTKDGEPYWVQATISPNYDDQSNKIGYTAIRQNITDKKIIENISITDGLTQIFNRRHFNEVFPKVIESAKRENQLLSFVILDIDYFKQYNDTYGHQMGDTVLIEIAKCIKNSLKRADDYCFRLGGEEFGILYKTDTKEKSINFVESIRQGIEDLHIKHAKSSVSDYVTASFGMMCIYANEINNHEEIYRKTDELLYKSKESGRNKVSVNKMDRYEK